jgi:general secretion pathway protein J
LTHFYSTNNHLRPLRSQQGFTLVEVLVAISILSLLITGVYGVFSTISTTQKQLENASEGYHQARIIFSRIGRELRSSYLDINNEQSAFVADGESDANNYLAFTSTSAALNSSTLGGLVRVRYASERQAEDELGRLIRSAAPLNSPDSLPDGQRLSSQIKQISWRFFDGSDWQTSWDSTTSTSLPQSVEISITTQYADQEIELMTAFDISLPRITR